MKLNVLVFNGYYGYRDGYESWHYDECNSAGGVSAKGDFSFSGDKDVKYITFYMTPKNRVYDEVMCLTRRISERGLECTGPYKPGIRYSFFGENMWYNNTISSISVTKAKVIYMDGSEEIIQGSDIGCDVSSTGATSSYSSSSGCYVATAVYGSYDCPQVWTLRRFRDYDLAETWYGRSFIRIYYTVSPTIVKLFGNKKWFKNIWRGKLDRLVKKLQEKGYESTPYEDREWK